MVLLWEPSEADFKLDVLLHGGLLLDVHNLLDGLSNVELGAVLAKLACSDLAESQDVLDVEQQQVAAGDLNAVTMLKVLRQSILLLVVLHVSAFKEILELPEVLILYLTLADDRI